MVNGLSVAFASFIAWFAVLASFFVTSSWPRAAFVAAHYALDITVFALAFSILCRLRPGLKPFDTTATAMVTLFLAEFVYWRFFYVGPSDFFNFADWIFPAFLIATTIYTVTKLCYPRSA